MSEHLIEIRIQVNDEELARFLNSEGAPPGFAESPAEWTAQDWEQVLVAGFAEILSIENHVAGVDS